VVLSLGLLLGAALSAYVGLGPQAVGLSFPSLGGELAVHPTFNRIAGYMVGRWLGSCLLGGLAGWLGSVLQLNSFSRLSFALLALLAVFMFLFLAAEHSPEIVLAKATNPARLHFPPFFLGFFSAGTLLAPLIMGILFALLQRSIVGGILFFTNIFLGTALVILPHILNMAWVKHPVYQWVLKALVFFCAVSVLILSITWLLKS
jgi:hypothetical protein